MKTKRKTTTGQKTVECFICSEDICGESIEDVIGHIQRKHLKSSTTGVLTLKCLRLHCRKIFVLKDDSAKEIKARALEMVDHQVRFHREDKPAYLPVNSCPVCRFWTYVPDMLMDHMRDKHNSPEVLYADDISFRNSVSPKSQVEAKCVSQDSEKTAIAEMTSAADPGNVCENRKRKNEANNTPKTVAVVAPSSMTKITHENLLNENQGRRGDQPHTKVKLIDGVENQTTEKGNRKIVECGNEVPEIAGGKVRELTDTENAQEKMRQGKNVRDDQDSDAHEVSEESESHLRDEQIVSREGDELEVINGQQNVTDGGDRCAESKDQASEGKELGGTENISGQPNSGGDNTDSSAEAMKIFISKTESKLQLKRSGHTQLKIFQCFLCRPWIIFSSYVTLRQHFTEKHFNSDGKSLSLTCPDCLNVFLSRARGEKHLIISLAQHMHQVHQMAAPEFLTSGVVVCPECTVWTMDDGHMKHHAVSHAESDVDVNQDLYKCFVCDKSREFRCWPEFRDHFVQEHVTMDGHMHHGVICSWCQKFISLENQQVTWSSLVALMADHMIKEHHMTVPPFVTRYTCTKCNFSTLLRRSFTGHQLYHDRADKVSEGNKATGTSYECFICLEMHYSWADLVAHFKTAHFSVQNKEVSLTCPCCGVSLTFLLKKCSPYGVYMTRLVQHMVEAHKFVRPAYIKEYACEGCSYSTVVQDNYRAHMKQHKKIKKECPHCFIMLSPSGLWRHLKVCRALGPQQRHLVCTQCNSTFAQEHQLKQHKAKVHSTESRYKCSHCEKSFYRKDGLIMHLFNDHGENPESRILVTCKQCSYVTLYEYHLKDHVKKLHTIGHFPCGRCGKTFQKYYSYNKHICHGKKPHQESNIVIPQRLYSKVKLDGQGDRVRFFCKFCDYSTSYKICLQVHLKTLHSSEWNRRKVSDPVTSASDPVTSASDPLTPDPDNEVVVETNSDQNPVIEELIVKSSESAVVDLEDDLEGEEALTVLLLEAGDDGSVTYQIIVSDDQEMEEVKCEDQDAVNSSHEAITSSQEVLKSPQEVAMSSQEIVTSGDIVKSAEETVTLQQKTATSSHSSNSNHPTLIKSKKSKEDKSSRPSANSPEDEHEDQKVLFMSSSDVEKLFGIPASSLVPGQQILLS